MLTCNTVIGLQRFLSLIRKAKQQNELMFRLYATYEDVYEVLCNTCVCAERKIKRKHRTNEHLKQNIMILNFMHGVNRFSWNNMILLCILTQSAHFIDRIVVIVWHILKAILVERKLLYFQSSQSAVFLHWIFPRLFKNLKVMYLLWFNVDLFACFFSRRNVIKNRVNVMELKAL